MSFIQDFKNLHGAFRDSPIAVSIVMLGLAAWTGLGAWLIQILDFPEAFGSTCQRKCMFDWFQFSPALLREEGAAAYILFGWIWAIPVLVAGVFIHAFIRKRGIFKNR